ncbi:MAG: hypothetical protein AAF415_18775 [Pseudomonadota bacterium]
MRLDAALQSSAGSFSSVETLLIAAIVPVVIAVMIGLSRETAVIAGVLSALAVFAVG